MTTTPDNVSVTTTSATLDGAPTLLFIHGFLDDATRVGRRDRLTGRQSQHRPLRPARLRRAINSGRRSRTSCRCNPWPPKPARSSTTPTHG